MRYALLLLVLWPLASAAQIRPLPDVRRPSPIPTRPTQPIPEPSPRVAPVQIQTATLAPLSPQALLDRVPVWRTQIRVHTCNVEGGGTEGEVWVRLHAPEDRGGNATSAAGSGTGGAAVATASDDATRFWIDRGGDDRRRGAMETYEIMMPGISTVRDISRIEFGTNSTDDWCIDRVALVVNSTGSWSEALHVYDQELEPTWLRNDRASTPSLIVATDEDLRASPSWNLDGARVTIPMMPEVIPGETLRSMLEASMGHLIATGQPLDPYKWGRRRGPQHLSMRRHATLLNMVTAKADLNTSGSVRRMNDVDITFKVVALCDGGALTLHIADITGGPSSLLRVFADPFGIAAITTTLNTLSRAAGRHGRNRAENQEETTPLACTDGIRFEPDGTLRLQG